jgi:hypothetical protein
MRQPKNVLESQHRSYYCSAHKSLITVSVGRAGSILRVGNPTYSGAGLHRPLSTRQVAMPKGDMPRPCPTLVSVPLCGSME